MSIVLCKYGDTQELKDLTTKKILQSSRFMLVKHATCEHLGNITLWFTSIM